MRGPSPGAATRSLGVIGWPVEHSYSPAMQQAALDALGLDWRYLAFPVAPGRLEEAIRGAGALGFVGLNVTIPHKETALPFCRPEPEAARVGAVNTLVFDERDAPPRGLNTDLHGFRMLLSEAGVTARGARATILGAGGAARAAARVLVDEGAEVTVVTRSDRALELDGGAPLASVEWQPEALAACLSRTEVLVDATGRSLDPGSRFDVEPLPTGATVLDLVVLPTTPLVAAARARGLRARAGAAMLLHQGAAALEAWTGREAPIDVMRKALASALASR